MRNSMSPLVVLAWVASGGCSSPRTDGGASGRATTSAAASASASVSAPAASSGPIGVAECDAYIEKMRACARDAPEADRAKRTESIDAIEKQWKERARVDSKATLVDLCKAATHGLDQEGSGCKR